MESPQFSIEDLRKFIVNWNNQFPVDYWYRKKYNIAFNSPQHREMSILDIVFEHEEEKILNKSVKTYKEDRENAASLKLTGKMLKEVQYVKLTEKQQEEWFDSINLDDFNKNITPPENNS